MIVHAIRLYVCMCFTALLALQLCSEVRSCFDRMLYDRVFLSEGTLTTKIGHLLKEFEPKVTITSDDGSHVTV